VFAPGGDHQIWQSGAVHLLSARGVDFPGGMAYMEDMNHNRIPASLGKMRRRAVHSRPARTSDNLRCPAAPVDL
jgi:hypothetical protein